MTHGVRDHEKQLIDELGFSHSAAEAEGGASLRSTP